MEQTTRRLAVLLFTDIVGSVDLKQRVGTESYARMLARHGELFEEAVSIAGGGAVAQDTGDGFLLESQSASQAVNTALAFQDLLARESWPAPGLRVRVGIHQGEVLLQPTSDPARPRLVGLAIDLASRVMSLAIGGQILLTRPVFDDARQYVRQHPQVEGESPALRWMAHGRYQFKGMREESLEVCEVGAEGRAPLVAPPDGEKARRVLDVDEESTLGWRPAGGLTIPGRPEWTLIRLLGKGGFGEVWLAEHRALRARRVFKFCFDAERLRSFRREVTLFRLLRDALGDRQDLVRLHGVELETSPYYLESDYFEEGNLAQWSVKQGGLHQIPLADRLRLVAETARAAAAAHSVGIIHKDIKPSNVLIDVDADQHPHARLSDFGIGVLLDRERLQQLQITEAGFTSALVEDNESSRTGTRLYAAPEYLTGSPPSIPGDVFALGVMLYQLVVADLDRPLAQGWERDIEDELLREDVSRCVDRDPARRFSNAGLLADSLERLEERRAERARQLDQERRARSRRRLFRAVAAAAAVLLLVAGLCLWGLLRERGLRQLAQDLAEREQTANRQAQAATQVAQAASQEAQESLRQAQRQLADSRLSEGRMLLVSRHPLEAETQFSQARSILVSLGESTWPAELAQWNLRRQFAPALMRYGGHQGAIQAVVATPDGERVLSGGIGGMVREQELATGKLVREWQAVQGGIYSLSLSPDGTRLAVGGNAGEQGGPGATVWDLESHGKLTEFSGHATEVWSLAFSPDGMRIASVSLDKTIAVWDASDGQELARFSSNETTGVLADGANRVAFLPDGERLLTGNWNGKLAIWNIADAKRERSLMGHQGPVWALRVSADGHRALSGGNDRTVRLWDLEAGEQLGILVGHDEDVRCVDLSSDGERALSGGSDGTVRIWSLLDGRELRVFHEHRRAVMAACFTRGGEAALSGGHDMLLRLWGLESPEAPRELPGAGDSVLSFATSPDGLLAATGDIHGRLVLWDIESAQPLRATAAHRLGIWEVAFSPDGEQVATASADNLARVWRVRDGQRLIELPHRGGVQHVAFAPDGRSLLTLTFDGAVTRWDAATGESLSSHDVDGEWCRNVALSGDRKRALTAHYNGMLRLWDTETGQTLQELGGHSGSSWCVDISPDGTRGLSGGTDHRVILWDLAAGRPLRALEGHTNSVNTVRFSPNRLHAVSCGMDGVVRLWRLQDGEELLAIGGQGKVSGASFVADQRLASYGGDGGARLWDLRRATDWGDGIGDPGTRLPNQEELGAWFEFRGAWGLATAEWELARQAGLPVDSLQLGRAYWANGRPDAALREFQAALRGYTPSGADGPARLRRLQLCVDALSQSRENPKTVAPAEVPPTMIKGERNEAARAGGPDDVGNTEAP